jgi:hypothetical protein
MYLAKIAPTAAVSLCLARAVPPLRFAKFPTSTERVIQTGRLCNSAEAMHANASTHNVA